MATHSNEGRSGRFFDIKIKKDDQGQTGKDSTSGPAFFELVKEFPNPIPASTKTETRGDLKFMLHEGISGFLKNIYTREVDVAGKKKPVKYLNFVLEDSEGRFNISTGGADDRYSVQLMKRILDPNFDITKVLYVGVYMIHNKDTNTYSKGISAKSGDVKLKADKDASHLAECPKPVTVEVPGQDDVTSYWPVVNWLMTQLPAKLPKEIFTKPESAAAVAAEKDPPFEAQPAPTPKAVEVPNKVSETTSPPVDDSEDFPF